MTQWSKCLMNDDVRASFDRMGGHCLEKCLANKIGSSPCGVKRQNSDMICSCGANSQLAWESKFSEESEHQEWDCGGDSSFWISGCMGSSHCFQLFLHSSSIRYNTEMWMNTSTNLHTGTRNQFLSSRKALGSISRFLGLISFTDSLYLYYETRSRHPEFKKTGNTKFPLISWQEPSRNIFVIPLLFTWAYQQKLWSWALLETSQV